MSNSISSITQPKKLSIVSTKFDKRKQSVKQKKEIKRTDSQSQVQEGYESIQFAKTLCGRIELMWRKLKIPEEDRNVFNANFFDDPHQNLEFLKKHLYLLFAYMHMTREIETLIEERNASLQDLISYTEHEELRIYSNFETFVVPCFHSL